MKKLCLNIEGMHCNSCAINIDFDLEDLGGVIQSRTSYAKSKTEVEYDEKLINEKEIIQEILNTGYKATTAG